MDKTQIKDIITIFRDKESEMPREWNVDLITNIIYKEFRIRKMNKDIEESRKIKEKYPRRVIPGFVDLSD